MPIYEYRCADCGELMEVMQKISAPAPTDCEHCNAKNSLSKQLSAPNFQLKGGGWYKDGYASKKPDTKSTDKSDDKPADKPADSSKTDSKKTESKPAAKDSSSTTKKEK